ncbi:MAG: hypothetical protein HDS85_02715 [Bacteroidales bacterium]|nr:hypothetical protein [Bacteroidales bacterium]
MKKILLSLAVMLGATSIASADTVKLVVNDATDIKGTVDNGNYVPVESCKIGDFSFTFTYGADTPSGSVPKLWKNADVWQMRLFSQYENQVVMTAPEGCLVTKVLINDKQNRDAGYTSTNGTVTFPKIDNFTYTQWENAEGQSQVIIKTDRTSGKNAQWLDLEVTFSKEGGAANVKSFEDMCGMIIPQAEGSYSAQAYWGMSGFCRFEYYFTGATEVNKDCKESIVVTCNGQPFGQPISAADAEVELDFGDYVFNVVPNGMAEPKTGEYVITIPEGFFTQDGVHNAAYTATYNFVGAPDFADIITMILPDDEIEDATAFDVWSTGNYYVQLNVKGNVAIGEAEDPITLKRDGVVVGKRIYDYTANGVIIQDGGFNPMAEGDDDATSKMIIINFLETEEGEPEAGEYVLSIPKGFFTLDGVDLSSYEHKWTIASKETKFEDILVSIIPDDANEETSVKNTWAENGQVMAGLNVNGDVAINTASTDKVTMTLNGEAFGVAIDANSPYIQIQDVEATADEAAVAKMIMMIFNPEDEDATLAPGTYTMNIPAGFFKIGSSSLTAYTHTWIVEGEKEVDFTYELTPADGATVDEELEEVLVTFTGAKDVKFVGTAANVKFEGPETMNAFGAMNMGANTISLFTLDMLGDGEWTVTVPAGSFEVDGAAFDQELTWSFTVALPKQELPEISPAAGNVKQEDLNTITFTYPEGTEVVPAEEDMYMILLTPADPTNGFSIGYVIDYEASKDNVLVIKTQGTGELGNGEWTLELYPNTWTINGQSNEAFKVVYTVTNPDAVSSIFADAESFDVYGINGVVILKGAAAADVNALPEGLYIINGKKVIIRK